MLCVSLRPVQPLFVGKNVVLHSCSENARSRAQKADGTAFTNASAIRHTETGEFQGCENQGCENWNKNPGWNKIPVNFAFLKMVA